MTQGVVSVLLDYEVIFKIITGHDGYNGPKLARSIKALGRVPDLKELFALAEEHGFGHPDDIVIVGRDGIHSQIPLEDFGEEGRKRYTDTLSCAHYNPRWAAGTADYVEIVSFGAQQTCEYCKYFRVEGYVPPWSLCERPLVFDAPFRVLDNTIGDLRALEVKGDFCCSEWEECA